jgi:hypothetical protein
VPAGLYRTIRDDILGLWNAGWTHSDVPTFWRSDDRDPMPDPSTAAHFLRNEVDFGAERLIAYGAGRAANLKAQFGSVVLRTFTARAVGDEDAALDLMADAMGIFRSQRITDGLGNDLSFVGDGSGFDAGPTEDGNWFMRGSLIVWEYRFRG